MFVTFPDVNGNGTLSRFGQQIIASMRNGYVRLRRSVCDTRSVRFLFSEFISTFIDVFVVNLSLQVIGKFCVL